MYLKPINGMTQEESVLLKQIDDKYVQSTQEIDKKINLLSIQVKEAREKAKKENRPFTAEEQAICNELQEASNIHITLYDEWIKEREEAAKNANQRTIAYYTQSAENALTFIKNNVPAGIELYGIMAGNNLTQKESEQAKALHQMAEEEIRELRKRLEADKKRLESEPDNINIKRSIAALENILNKDNLTKSNYDLFFSDIALRENICKTFFPYLSFLSNTSLEAYKEACAFIDDCIKHKNEYLTPNKLVPSYKTKKPTSWKSPVSKLAEELFNGNLYDPSNQRIITSRRTARTEYTTLACCDYADEAIQILGNRKLEEFDRNVHDAVVTLYVSGGNTVITPRMVKDNMVYNNSRLTDVQLDKISNSLTKLMFTPMRVNLSKENPKEFRGFSVNYTGMVIEARKLEAAKVNGEIVAEAYYILAEPYIYTYSAAKSQVISVKPEVLQIDTISRTTNVINLTAYLTRRVEAMKKNKDKKTMSHKIRYDTIFERLGLEASTEGALRKKKTKVRNSTREILNHWVEIKYIKGYEENKKGREIESITILL